MCTSKTGKKIVRVVTPEEIQSMTKTEYFLLYAASKLYEELDPEDDNLFIQETILQVIFDVLGLPSIKDVTDIETYVDPVTGNLTITVTLREEDAER